MSTPSYPNLYRDIDFRKHPEKYQIGRGEQGVLIAEPYKSEILPYWKFATPADAHKSATKIYDMFQAYGRQSDFVGMDMARKFLQMGFTRSRRYANHASGQKYDGSVPVGKKGQSGAHGRSTLPQDIGSEDGQKAESARIFKGFYDRARTDQTYLEQKAEHKALQAKLPK